MSGSGDALVKDLLSAEFTTFLKIISTIIAAIIPLLLLFVTVNQHSKSIEDNKNLEAAHYTEIKTLISTIQDENFKNIQNTNTQLNNIYIILTRFGARFNVDTTINGKDSITTPLSFSN